MKPHSQTRLRRVALLLALATIVVSPLPASSAPHGKGKSTGSGGTGCPSGLDVSRSGQPSVPLAIAVGVFTGQRKGLIAPDEIILSTRLRNAAWTTFYRQLSAPGVTDYISGPETIPTVHVGDVINVTAGGSALGYRALATALSAGSMVVAPVVTFGARRTATVVGFATLQITTIKGRGNPKYLDGTVLSLDLDPCFVRP
jgi:hypothetical protein